MTWTNRNLLGLRGLPAPALRGLLDDAHRADAIAPNELAGRTVANLFFEDSTRTRVSFTVAAQRVGAGVVDLTAQGSSLSKGETLGDTARTLEAMGVDVLVTRTTQSGGSKAVADAVACAVINAGDGRHEHPTQGLADALTIGRAFDRTDGWDFTDLRVAIVGDVVSSRVARSNVAALATLGAQTTLVGPGAMAPRALEGALGCAVWHDLDQVLPEMDVVMMLRIQFERHGGSGMGSRRDYRHAYALTEARAEAMKPGAIVMHPGPMNRGLEIDSTVADGPRSVITRQVSHGVAVRMAALKACVQARVPTA